MSFNDCCLLVQMLPDDTNVSHFHMTTIDSTQFMKLDAAAVRALNLLPTTADGISNYLVLPFLQFYLFSHHLPSLSPIPSLLPSLPPPSFPPSLPPSLPPSFLPSFLHSFLPSFLAFNSLITVWS